MRLKVSPKAALVAVDSLIFEGFKLQQEHGDELKHEYSLHITTEDRKDISDWHTRSVKTLKGVFLDFAPVYFFWRSIEEEKVEDYA